MPNTPGWQIELSGSELARVEQHGPDLVIVLAAARVPGDRRKQGQGPIDGHLQGVRLHLLQATWKGCPSAMVGRLDEVTWACGQTGATRPRSSLNAPSSGTTPIRLSLCTALGDHLEVQAQAWRIDLLDGGRFTPSLAC